MDIGSICVCMAIGALIVFASIGIGVCFGRCDKGQHNDDSDVRTYVPIRDRSGSGDKRDDKPTYEEKIMVLNTLRTGTTIWEHKVIDSIEEDVDHIREMDSRREEASQD